MERIVIFNKSIENIDGENVFDISNSTIFANPFTLGKTNRRKNLYHVKDENEGLEWYEAYFDRCYMADETFRNAFDTLFIAYLKYDTIYLGMHRIQQDSFDYSPIIKKKLISRSLKSKVNEIKSDQDAS